MQKSRERLQTSIPRSSTCRMLWKRTKCKNGHLETFKRRARCPGSMLRTALYGNVFLLFICEFFFASIVFTRPPAVLFLKRYERYKVYWVGFCYSRCIKEGWEHSLPSSYTLSSFQLCIKLTALLGVLC